MKPNFGPQLEKIAKYLISNTIEFTKVRKADN